MTRKEMTQVVLEALKNAGIAATTTNVKVFGSGLNPETNSTNSIRFELSENPMEARLTTDAATGKDVWEIIDYSKTVVKTTRKEAAKELTPKQILDAIKATIKRELHKTITTGIKVIDTDTTSNGIVTVRFTLQGKDIVMAKKEGEEWHIIKFDTNDGLTASVDPDDMTKAPEVHVEPDKAPVKAKAKAAAKTSEVQVALYAFTGMDLGKYVAVKTAEGQYLVTTKAGKMLAFDAKTLKQVDAKKPGFANYIKLL